MIFLPKLFTLYKNGELKNNLLSDIFSGAVVGVVALPLAIAFAVASGLSPEKGLITAIIAGFIISAFGGSRVQIGGPTGAFIVLIFSIVKTEGVEGLLFSTFLAGIFLILFGLMRLGTLLKYFPRPLIVGFTTGIAIIIFSTQIKDALGLEIQDLPSEFAQKWMAYFTHLSSINYWAVGITLSSIIITLFFPKLFPKVPGSFVAIIVITLVVTLLKLPVTTIETFFGEIPTNISVSTSFFQFDKIVHFIKPALSIALLGSIESLLSAVVADGMIGGKHRSNTELIAQGLANMASPFFGGIPATGAIARTATNVKNGGRTPLAGIIHALVLLLIMLFLGNWAKLIPMSCLAGILIVVSYNMSELHSFIHLLRSSFFDSLVLLTTFLLTVFFDLTLAIEVGVVLSSLLFMKRMADMAKIKPNTPIDSDVIEDYTRLPKDIKVYEISGPLFFASAAQYFEIIEQVGVTGKVIVIRMRHVSFIDQTAINHLKGTIKSLKGKHIKIVLSGVNSSVFKELENSGITALIGSEHILNAFDKAIDRAKSLIN